MINDQILQRETGEFLQRANFATLQRTTSAMNDEPIFATSKE